MEEYISFIEAGDDKDTIMDFKAGRQKSNPKPVFFWYLIYNLCGAREYSEAIENTSLVKGRSASGSMGM